jgi:type II secretory pathway pseudopilin PulG
MKTVPQRVARGGEEGGFTFLELIVVLVMMTLLTSAIVPIYVGSMKSLRVRNQKHDFVGLLAFLQEQAVSESREYRLCADPETQSYRVMYLAGYDADHEKIFEDVPDHFGRQRYLPENLEFGRIRAPKDRQLGVFYIGCYPNGACDRAEINFEDQDNRDRSFRVKTGGFMGRFEVKE